VASSDTSQYKVVKRNQLVVGFPIDEGVLSFQNLYDEAIVSPAYDIWELDGERQVDSRYLERFLRSRTALAFYAAKLRGTTARRRSLPDDIFLSLAVPLPDLAEQGRIAETLNRVDALRAKRRAALAQVDTLTQSIFLDLFGDPRSNPRKWNTRPLRDLVVEFRYGTSNKSNSHGYPALRIPNVVGGVIDISDLKLVPVDSSEFVRLKLHEGDVLFVRTNGNPDSVGRCAVFSDSVAANSDHRSDDFIFASYLIRARLKGNEVNPVFLREFMLGAEGRRQLRRRSKTSAGQFNINTESLGAITIPLPPLDLQSSFVELIGNVEKLKSAHHSSLTELDALFAVLQHRAFRGEL